MGTLSKDVLKVERLLPEINANHRECIKSGREAVNHAIQAGELLLELKEAVKHGEWEETIKRCDFSLATAKTYMTISDKLPEIMKSLGKEGPSELTIRGGMKLIAEAKKPKPSQIASAPAISPKAGGNGSHKTKSDAANTVDAVSVRKSEPIDPIEAACQHEWDDEACTKCHAPRPSKISGGTTFDVAELTSEAKDAFGKEAPDDLRQAFELAGEFDAARAKLTAIKSWMTQRKNHPGAVLLAGAAQRIRTDIDNADREIKFTKPHCVCVYCRNKSPKVANCTACKGLGWITQPIYEAAPKEMQREKVKS